MSSVEPGIFYPRIWRGYYLSHNLHNAYNAVNPTKEYGSLHTQSAVAASSLFDYLLEIFRHIEPSIDNYRAYGHKIRELLILACTEIEAGWRAVLQENTNPQNRKDRYNTTDYYSVKEPLLLDHWSVALTDSHLGEFKPFETWDCSRATESLPWYNAYNYVKHNRETEFSKATLGNLLNAMAALHIMQVAQWGPEIYSIIYDNRSSPFYERHSPPPNVAEIYIPSIDGKGTMTAGLFFERSKSRSWGRLAED